MLSIHWPFKFIKSDLPAADTVFESDVVVIPFSASNYQNLNKYATIINPVCEKSTVEWKCHINGVEIDLYDYKNWKGSGTENEIHIKAYGPSRSAEKAAVERMIRLYELGR